MARAGLRAPGSHEGRHVAWSAYSESCCSLPLTLTRPLHWLAGLAAGLRTYPNYMMGGGYVVSGEVARVLVGVHARMRLKFTPIEDATLGFWLMAMDLRHVDHPRFYTWAAPCCFRTPIR